MTSSQQSNDRKILPIGIQDFRAIRQDNHYYVDKTQLIDQLVSQGRHYFLSRPRRFGKSLLLDTFRKLFDCQEELFRGLYIHDKWDWSEKHPVVRLSFDAQYNEPAMIESHVLAQLERIAGKSQLDLPSTARSGPELLEDVLDRLHSAFGRTVVVLVDEYDKPILDMLENEEKAKANRDYLSGLYGVIKGSAEHVRFVFVTGISMFSKLKLFSQLNNLKDISLDPRYATICGYTDEDLDRYFAPELPGFDRQEIRRWYNGYNWLGEQRVYNPYDILFLFDSGEFDSHWFQVGTPTFLYRVMTKDRVSSMELENIGVDKNQLTSFDVGDIDLRALMFQSGYLTIGEKLRVGTRIEFTLEYPNLEVQENFSTGFLSHMGLDEKRAYANGSVLLEHLSSNEFGRFEEVLATVYDAIPHDWYRKNSIERYEGYYLSVLYTHLKAVGADIHAERSSSRGQADIVLEQSGQVFVMEAKVAEDESEALVEKALVEAMDQIRERGYGDQYRGRGQAIHFIAMVFGQKSRSLIGCAAETA